MVLCFAEACGLAGWAGDDDDGGGGDNSVVSSDDGVQ